MTQDALTNTGNRTFGKASDLSLEIKTPVQVMKLPYAMSTLLWICCGASSPRRRIFAMTSFTLAFPSLPD